MMANGMSVHLGNGIIIEMNTLMALLIVVLMFVIVLYSLSIIRYAIKKNFCIKRDFLGLESLNAPCNNVNYYDKMLDYKDKISAISPVISVKPKTIIEWLKLFFKKSN